MWKRTISVLPLPALCHQVNQYLMFLKGEKYRNDFLRIYESALGVQDRWNFLQKIPKIHLSFTSKELQQGNLLLTKLGVPTGARFVCLLMRDAGYLQSHLPKMDWSYHDYRNVDVSNYYKSAQFLAEQGYYVIRMGKNVQSKFNVNHPKVIDYANSPLRSDFLDIYLTAHCFFMISTSCGLDSVAQIFRKPILITDFPLTELASWFFWDFFIPKKIFDKKENRYVTFQEIYQQRALFADKKLMVKEWKNMGWQFVDNTPEEILAAVTEMLKKLNNKWFETPENQLNQQKFWQNFPLELPEKLISYQDVKLRIGHQFLENNPFLLN